jgi:hypothetical protein
MCLRANIIINKRAAPLEFDTLERFNYKLLMNISGIDRNTLF